VRLAADGDRTAAGLVGRLDAVVSHDDAAGREVRTGDLGHEVFDGGLRVVDKQRRGVDHFAEVVRRNVCRHTDRDTRRAVHEQVGVARRQYQRLRQRLVIVGTEIYGLLVEVAQQLHGKTVQSRLRIAHRGRGVAVDGTEVSVSIDQRCAHRERLCQSNHRVVDS